MPKYLDDFKDIKAIFNIVPSLAVQIEDYSSKKANDNLLIVLKNRLRDLLMKKNFI